MEAKQQRVLKVIVDLHPAYASMAWSCSFHAGKTAGCGLHLVLIVDDGNGHNHKHWISTLVKQWYHLNTNVFKISVENRYYFATDYFNKWGLLLNWHLKMVDHIVRLKSLGWNNSLESNYSFPPTTTGPPACVCENGIWYLLIFLELWLP